MFAYVPVTILGPGAIAMRKQTKKFIIIIIFYKIPPSEYSILESRKKQ